MGGKTAVMPSTFSSSCDEGFPAQNVRVCVFNKMVVAMTREMSVKIPQTIDKQSSSYYFTSTRREAASICTIYHSLPYRCIFLDIARLPHFFSREQDD